jgi:hypothetical protein
MKREIMSEKSITNSKQIKKVTSITIDLLSDSLTLNFLVKLQKI